MEGTKDYVSDTLIFAQTGVGNIHLHVSKMTTDRPEVVFRANRIERGGLSGQIMDFGVFEHAVNFVLGEPG